MALARLPLAGAALLLVLAAPARAELRQPACEALAAWAEGHERGAAWAPNALGLGARNRFAAVFAAPSTADAFGKPVLDWTPDESRALAPHFQSCAEALRRARQSAAATALGQLRNQVLRDIPAYLGNLAEARAAIPAALAELAEAPASVALLRLHQALAAIGREPGAGERASRAANGVPGPARNTARALLNALRDLPEAEIPPALAAVAPRLDPLRAALADALIAEAEAVPATAAGRQQLDRRMAQAMPEHAPDLGPAETARVEAAVAARRGAIAAALRADLLHQIASVPDDPMGAQMIAMLRQRAQGLGEALGAEERRAVEAAAGARLAAIGSTITGRLLGLVAGAPASAEGLAGLQRLEAQSPAPQILALIGPDGLARIRAEAAARRAALAPEVVTALLARASAVPVAFEGFDTLDRLAPPPLRAALPETEGARLAAGLAARRAAIAEALLPGFRTGLARLPATDEGLAAIEDQVLPELRDLPASAEAEQARFLALAQDRRAAILAAVNRAEAGPLRGRVYANDTLKLEFLDRGRVIATLEGAAPAAGTYEEVADGRVILDVNGESLVLTREGRRLAGGPLVLRRAR